MNEMTNRHEEIWKIVSRLGYDLEEWARSIIPAHLDEWEIIDNSWENTADVPVEDVVECFRGTVEMYIDQNCSHF